MLRDRNCVVLPGCPGTRLARIVPLNFAIAIYYTRFTWRTLEPGGPSRSKPGTESRRQGAPDSSGPIVSEPPCSVNLVRNFQATDFESFFGAGRRRSFEKRFRCKQDGHWRG